MFGCFLGNWDIYTCDGRSSSAAPLEEHTADMNEGRGDLALAVGKITQIRKRRLDFAHSFLFERSDPF